MKMIDDATMDAQLGTAVRKEYHTPKIEDLGGITQMVQSNCGVGTDGGLGSVDLTLQS
jgi:hypothetical protein